MKTTKEERELIREMYFHPKEGEKHTIAELAAMFGLSVAGVYKILHPEKYKGKRWGKMKEYLKREDVKKARVASSEAYRRKKKAFNIWR